MRDVLVHAPGLVPQTAGSTFASLPLPTKTVRPAGGQGSPPARMPAIESVFCFQMVFHSVVLTQVYCLDAESFIK